MIKIIEPIADDTAKTETVYLTVEVPLSLRLFGKRADEDYISITREHLQIETQTIFKHIQTLSSLESGCVQDFKIADFKEILQTLSYIGKGLIEAQGDEYLEIDKNQNCRNAAPGEVGKDSEIDKLADQISEVLKNPNLPAEIYNAILQGKDQIINTSESNTVEKFETSPEHIKEVLKLRL